MKAEFFANGRIEIRDDQGELCVAGHPEAKPGAPDYHPMMAYAIELMKLKGDWPKDPLVPQQVELVD